MNRPIDADAISLLATAIDHPAIAEYLQRNDESFGGAYIDSDRTRARWIVAFTTDAPHHRGALRRLFAYPERMEVVTVERTWISLRQLTDRIARDIGALESDGIGVTSLGPDPRTNRVVVRVESDVASARAALSARYRGEPIDVTNGTRAIPLAESP